MYETLFRVFNGLATLPWLLLIFAPRWRGTEALARTPLAPLILGVGYAALLVVTLSQGGEGGMGSLADVRVAFESDAALLLGWVHYLAFDLMVGLWEWRDSRRLGIRHALLVPCLLFTFVLGPVGLLLYCGVRWIVARRTAFEEVEA